MYQDQLFFSGPLNSASAENAACYHVMQKIAKKKTVNVKVVSATYMHRQQLGHPGSAQSHTRQAVSDDGVGPGRCG